MYPKQIFLDRKCTIPFPISLPEPAKGKIHRIVVAHGAAERCKAELGGSGSLMLFPGITAGEHTKARIDGGRPFALGQIDRSKGYVHILDDTSLGIILDKLDTITDFVEYLQKKERVILSGQLAGAAGEEELLAYYLKNLTEADEHDFIIPTEQHLFLDEGLWEDFVSSPQAKAQEKADKISYALDSIINTFIKNIQANTLYYTSHPNEGLAHYDKLLGVLAREPRFHRRVFSNALAGFLSRPVPTSQTATIRTIKPTNPGDPYYVFVAVEQPPFVNDDEYRKFRSFALETYCKVTKERFPDAQDIIGYATEPGLLNEGRSDDLLYFDAREWFPKDEADWAEIKRRLNVASSEALSEFYVHEDEYPVPNTTRINLGESFIDIRHSSTRQSALTLTKKSNKKPVKKTSSQRTAKVRKKKKGSRTTRTR